MSDNRPTEGSSADRVGRRGFFTQGFRHLLKPLADIVEKRMERMDLPTWTESSSTSLPRPVHGGDFTPYVPRGDLTVSSGSTTRRLLRPPGALEEEAFLSRCTSCGKCAEVCPVRAIELVSNPEPRLHKKPMIEAQRQACVICNDLACMKACPTGALQLVAASEIRMGLAVVDLNLCVRSRGEDCQICVDKCPIGPTAIDIPFPGGPVSVKDACTGCGVCEMYCPTDPRAVVVERR